MKKTFLLLVGLLFVSPAFTVTPWQALKTPIVGNPQSIGSYSNGCVVGAAALPLTNNHYQVLRSQKIRYYGHPKLIDFIQRFALSVNSKKLGTLLVGDMGMPGGGRFASGHASHQTGLDVDIWLQLPKTRWSQKQLTGPRAIDLVSRDGKSVVVSSWSQEVHELVKMAAKDDEVERIFVNPAIKKQLCLDENQDRDWLRKIRPWHGHRAHMHIRLACPKGSLECVTQTPIPKGDGCQKELLSWFDVPKVVKKVLKPKEPPPPPPPKICEILLDRQLKK